MAQQLGMMRVRGKLGNVVGYQNTASDKTNNSFYRERATSVKNPKTQKQATQRAKVKPAAAFYAAFENILNHAFLPSARAVKNRNKFMQRAMKLSQVPDVRREDNYLPVMPYQVSEGNLGLDYMTVPQSAPSADSLYFPYFGQLTQTEMTLAEWSSQILNLNSGLTNGEEITYLAVIAKANDPYVRRAEHISIVLNTSDFVTKIGDICENKAFTCDSDNLLHAISSSDKLLAGAIIISSKTSSSWRYTKSYMYLTEYAKGLPNITNEVILSYMSAEAQKTSELILQQADNEQTEGVTYIGITNAPVQMQDGYPGTLSPTSATLAVNNLGVRVPVVEIVDGEPILLYKNSSLNWVKIERTNESVSAYVSLETTTWQGNNYIELWELQESWPELC